MWFFDTIVDPVKTGAKSETATLEAESLLVIDATEDTTSTQQDTGDLLASMESTGDLIIIDDVPMTVTVDAVPDMVISEPEIVMQVTSDLVTPADPEPTAESLFVVDAVVYSESLTSDSNEFVSPEVTIARAIKELSASESYNESLIQKALDRVSALKIEKSNTEAAHAAEIQRLSEVHAARMLELDDQALASSKEVEKIEAQGKKTTRLLELLEAQAQS